MMPKLGTKLSDFSEDQLRLMLRLATRERCELEDQIERMDRSGIAVLLEENIAEDEALIKDLVVITTQVATELFNKESERTVASN